MVTMVTISTMVTMVTMVTIRVCKAPRLCQIKPDFFLVVRFVLNSMCMKCLLVADCDFSFTLKTNYEMRQILPFVHILKS